jgi:hypothetical protein
LHKIKSEEWTKFANDIRISTLDISITIINLIKDVRNKIDCCLNDILIINKNADIFFDSLYKNICKSIFMLEKEAEIIGLNARK